MKKIVSRFLPLVALAFFAALLSSCATSVSISYTEPSRVNMAPYRNVAVASAVPCKTMAQPPFYIRMDMMDPAMIKYAFYSSYLSSDVETSSANDLSDACLSVFSKSGYYKNVLAPAATDSILALSKIGGNPSENLKAAGYDAVIVPRVDSLRADEYISTHVETDAKTGSKTTRYALNRTVSMSCTVSVLDTAQNKVAAVRQYSSSASSCDYFDPSTVTFFAFFGTTMEDLAESCVSDMVSDMTADFSPRRAFRDVELKPNKPKNEEAKAAYDSVKDGAFSSALGLFLDIYKKDGHVPSGYNAALLLAATGDLDGALSLLSDVRTKSSDADVAKLYSRLVEMKRRNDAAMEQMASAQASELPSSSIYDVLLG